jgi:hypothetical protein
MNHVPIKKLFGVKSFSLENAYKEKFEYYASYFSCKRALTFRM